MKNSIYTLIIYLAGTFIVAEAHLNIDCSSSVGMKLMPKVAISYLSEEKQIDARTRRGVGKRSEIFDKAKKHSTILTIKPSKTAPKLKCNGDICISSLQHNINEKKLVYADNFGHELLAYDAIVIIINPRIESISSISIDELLKIYSGEIKNWSDMQSPNNDEIIATSWSKNSDTFKNFKSLVVNGNSKNILDIDSARIVESDEEVYNYISTTPNSIGFINRSFLKNKKTSKVKKILLTGKCGNKYIDDDFSIISGFYPLSTKLYIHSKRPTSSRSKKKLSIKYLTVFSLFSESSYKIIAKQGLIPKKIVTKEHQFNSNGLNSKPERLKLLNELNSFLMGYKKISVLIPFDNKSSNLSENAVGTINYLIEYLKGTTYRDVKIAGYTDNKGSYRNNLTISKERADTVKEVLEYNNIKIEGAKGFSDLSPIDCNSGMRHGVNRRVEIWVR